MAKKPVTELGKWTPKNLKFGIIVAIALLWANVLRNFVLDILPRASGWVADLYVAVIASILGYLVLLGYRKIHARIRKVRV